MRFLICFVVCLSFTTGCALNTDNQSRLEPFEASEFFSDNMSARRLPPNTIPYGYSEAPPGFYTGETADGAALLETFPVPVTEAVLAQGQTQYEVFCTPCHGQTGEGDGIIVQRGFSPPPSLHSDRLRQAPVGHYFNVITHGIGEMYDYADSIPPEDRWAIIAYIRSSLQGMRLDD